MPDTYVTLLRPRQFQWLNVACSLRYVAAETRSTRRPAGYTCSPVGPGFPCVREA